MNTHTTNKEDELDEALKTLNPDCADPDVRNFYRDVISQYYLSVLPEKLVSIVRSDNVNESEAYMDGFNEAVSLMESAIRNRGKA